MFLSDGGLDNRGGFERVLGGGPDGQIVSIQGGMAPRSKSLVMSSTNRMKRTRPSTEPWGTPRLMRKERLWNHQPGLSSTIRKEGAHPKNEARGEFEREEFVKKSKSARPSRKPWRSQRKPKSFHLEVFFFWKPSQID